MKKTIKLYGNIGGQFDGAWIEKELAGLTDKDIATIKIHSGGGEVFEGWHMMNIIKQCPAKTIAHGFGIWMSQATQIAAVCEESYATPTSMYMIHKASIPAYGNSDDIEVVQELLTATDKVILDVYHKKTGMPKERLLREFMTGRDKFLTPQEAVEYGFIDGIKEPEKEVITTDYYNDSDYILAFNKAKDVGIEDRYSILNKFITKTDEEMKNEKADTGVVDESPKLEVKGTDKELILSLNAEANSLRAVIANRDTEILNITKEKDLLEVKVDELQLEANEKIVKAENEKEKAVALLAKKDLELKVQEVSNAINLAVAKMKNADGTQINAEKEKSIITQFSQRHAITISDGVETVVDKVSGNVVADNIHSAVVAYAITAGLVQYPKKGIGTAANITNPDTYGSDFEKAQENSVLAEISKADKDLQKEGHAKFSETWCRVMNSKFPNNDKAVHPIDKVKYNLK